MAIQVVTPGSGGQPVNQPQPNNNESGVNANGGVGVIKLSGLSSDVVVAATALCTAYGSDIEIINMILKTDATGFAGGTNVQVLTNDALGLANILVEAVSNLGGNKTVDLNSASVTKQRTVIEQNKQIQINSTVAPCTGAGVWNLYIEYRPLGSAGVLA